MNVRRSAAALAAVGVLAAAAPAVAADPSASPSASAALPSGLYGDTDPQYDGVWRQSLALLAQHTAGVRPARKAVDWLTGQQCANGAFAAYRPAPAAACDAKVMVDTNSTAAAVQALKALGGQDDAATRALTWLKSVQNKDGGWGYTPGGASDANSTSVVIGALAAAGQKPDDVTKGSASPYDALLKLTLPCSGDGTDADADADADANANKNAGTDAGAFAYQPDKKGKLAANADATAAAVLGVLGRGLVTSAAKATAAPDSTCTDAAKPTPEVAAANGAGYLAAQVAKDGHLTSALPGADPQPDYGNTADAVVALAAQGGTARAEKPLAWLEQNAAGWAKKSGPAAYAQLIFAAHATGTDPRDFGGTDLVAALNATGPAPQAAETSAAPEKTKDDDSGSSVWWIVGVGLVAGIGIGFLLSGRRKQR